MRLWPGQGGTTRPRAILRLSAAACALCAGRARHGWVWRSGSAHAALPRRLTPAALDPATHVLGGATAKVRGCLRFLRCHPPPRPPPRTLPTPFRPLRLLLAVAGRRAADLRAHGHPRHVVCGGGHLLPPRRPAAAARGASGRPTLLAAADSLVADRGGSGSGRTVDGRCAAATTIGAVGTAGANGGAWGGAVAKRHRARGCSAFNLPRRGAGFCTPAAHPSGAAVGGCGGAAPADGVARPGPPARHVPLVCADGG